MRILRKSDLGSKSGWVIAAPVCMQNVYAEVAGKVFSYKVFFVFIFIFMARSVYISKTVRCCGLNKKDWR